MAKLTLADRASSTGPSDGLNPEGFDSVHGNSVQSSWIELSHRYASSRVFSALSPSCPSRPAGPFLFVDSRRTGGPRLTHLKKITLPSFSLQPGPFPIAAEALTLFSKPRRVLRSQALR